MIIMPPIKLIMKVFLFAVGWVVFLLACQSGANKEQSTVMDEPIAGYQWGNPVNKYYMPFELDEISGMTYYQKGQIACVQDEEGLLFVYDLKERKVADRIRFAKNGDYEGVTLAAKDIVVARSDGMLFRFNPKKEGSTIILETPLTLKNDLEGITYDSTAKELILSCKEDAGLGKEKIKGKAVYAYDLALQRFVSRPKYILNKKDLELALKAQGRDQKVKGFKPSGLDIHPITRYIFIVASVGRLIVVLEPDGTVVDVINLNPKLFKQPEGICFAPDGTLFISSEGSPGYIMEFEYQNKSL